MMISKIYLIKRWTMKIEQINMTNIDTENDETTNVHLTDNQDNYLLDKLRVYLTTTDKKRRAMIWLILKNMFL